ncbi:hypothetical protein HPC49_31305 [Pyxidicoccus fallax]|uniref:Uncharacterized protein n=1 Tax=Pyxidicoccus fallax TaxID=394095 RepID=A0A848LF35_9BACT|nr:hypothetical protein [Pyxidicoccus fallax]NMO16892.1 hypothetical protein [Pyxidicoccus fallax]NPC82698.1 hypothetical protein [Pyxidicoccus fallax]
MEILGFTVVGVIIFFALIFAVIIGGAFGNKQLKHLRELTEQQRAAGLTGDSTMNDPHAMDYDDKRHVPA